MRQILLLIRIKPDKFKKVRIREPGVKRNLLKAGLTENMRTYKQLNEIYICFLMPGLFLGQNFNQKKNSSFLKTPYIEHIISKSSKKLIN